jgi:CheY-like chemotaxis protein
MAAALELVQNEEFDAAIIDMNIRGTKTFSLMKILDRREIRT